MKKLLLIIFTCFITFNFLLLNTTTYAGVNEKVLELLKYDTTKELKISGVFNSKIDKVLTQKFGSDSYKQFLFLKTLNDKIVVLKNKSTTNKDLFNELEAYLHIKSDLLYKITNLSDNELITKINSEFKRSIEKKSTNFKSVLENVNNISYDFPGISQANDNFNQLTQLDFGSSLLNQAINDSIKTQKYKTISDILSESKTISLEDFKKIKPILTSDISMIDQYGNAIKGEIKKDTGLFASSSNVNDKLISIVNEKISDFGNIELNTIDNGTIMGVGDLYDIFGDKNIVYNFLYKTKTIGKIDKKSYIKNITEIKNNGDLKGYTITIKNYDNDNYIFSRDSYNSNIVLLYVLLSEDGTLKYYIDPGMTETIYLGNTKRTKEYLYINFLKKEISFTYTWTNGYTEENNLTDSNINIEFSNGLDISSRNKLATYSLRDFKNIINGEIFRININGEDIKTTLLNEKKSIINLYK